jgi:putative Mn2+ efflux pump MntP
MCDGLASFVGSMIGASWRSSLEWGEWLGPIVIGIYGAYVLSLAWHNRQLATDKSALWLCFGLPLCLSLDNLALGLGETVSPAWAAQSALAFGAASGSLALVGQCLGGALTSNVRLRSEWTGGGLLVGVALMLLCKQALS